MKLRDHLALLKKIAPKHTKHGQLYSNKKQTRGRITHVVLYTIFVSENGNFLLRPHVFSKKRPLSGAEWAAWFKSNLHAIQKSTILPAIERRTGGQEFWSVWRIVGWVAGAEPIVVDTGLSTQGDSSEEEGGENG